MLADQAVVQAVGSDEPLHVTGAIGAAGKG